jgi:hypothetical protein
MEVNVNMTNTLLAAASDQIRANDLVMVSYPIGEKTNNPAHRLDGEQFVVKSKRKVNTTKGGDTFIYELCGAVSKRGVPYSFLKDELIRL